MPVGECFLLDKLPPELRLAVYEELLLADEPIRGRVSRKEKKYGLSPAILAVSRQIYDEAHQVFFGKNTFVITSIPEDINTEASKESSPEAKIKALGRFDPPLHPVRWLSIRHLTIDLLYYPAKASTSAPRLESFKLHEDPAAVVYISNVVSVLRVSGPKLKSFKLAASVNHHFCARRSLISFCVCDRDRDFVSALAAVPLKKMPFHFDFAESYYHTELRPNVFVTRSILLLACQVMFCQSQVKIDRMLAMFENGVLKPESGVKEKMDLAPYLERKVQSVALKAD
ncbi:uncharacterized protein BDR25DRAFT_306443 [Lindgomyces ingoldianus]|uniref:Uncharacterized protein n=1 Tax=Lindgomyces ingoldianus TaxID=673940 RepID=A0ACB6QG72_9PLEO|nr:uncharacterized protein BDR25DRAFT_306443 [Lindgomyces ingoldianus]KAF2465978.1 hypothetical protein BDR25DRAFT_306443 [Lindgomyces ingoldianus]